VTSRPGYPQVRDDTFSETLELVQGLGQPVNLLGVCRQNCHMADVMAVIYLSACPVPAPTHVGRWTSWPDAGRMKTVTASPARTAKTRNHRSRIRVVDA